MQNTMNPNLHSTYSLIVVNLLPPAQGENGNPQFDNTLPFHQPLIIEDLGMMTSAAPMQENILLGLPGAMSPNNPFPELKALENQAGTARRSEEIQRRPLDRKLFQCSFCTYTSDKRYNVHVHEQQHDPNRKREFHCSECPTQFFSPHDRGRHIRSVHENELYVCPFCPNEYSRRGNLKIHINRNHYYM